MLISLLLAAASELETYDSVESAEVHIANFLFFCRDPVQGQILTHTYIFHKPLKEPALGLQEVLHIPQPG